MHYTVTLDDTDQALFVADTIATHGDTRPVTLDGATIAFGEDGLDILTALTDSGDVHFADGCYFENGCVWIGGIGYPVARS